jgi:hypothetical protein
MCEKCDQVDNQIRRYRRLAAFFIDQQILDGIERLIAELERRKLAFGCEAAK